MGKKIGGGGIKIVILSPSTSTEIPNHKTGETEKKNERQRKQQSKQAIRQGKLRKITKCLLTRFS